MDSILLRILQLTTENDSDDEKGSGQVAQKADEPMYNQLRQTQSLVTQCHDRILKRGLDLATEYTLGYRPKY